MYHVSCIIIIFLKEEKMANEGQRWGRCWGDGFPLNRHIGPVSDQAEALTVAVGKASILLRYSFVVISGVQEVIAATRHGGHQIQARTDGKDIIIEFRSITM